MSNALKCPNPSCPFLFDPTQVPPGSVLTCPRCGMRFMLGPAPANPAPPPPVPVSTDSSSAPPSPPAAPSRPTAGAIARAKLSGQHPATPRSRSPLFVTLAVVAFVGLACAAGFLLLSQYGPRGGESPVYEIPDFNFAYDFPGPPWEKDTAPPPTARANLFALRRDESEAHVTFSAAKFDARNPQPGDLREALLERLAALFEDLGPAEEQGATWAGQPAIKYTFRGVEKGTGTVCGGEGYAIGYQGIGYWSLAWAPEREVAARLDEFRDLRGRFKLLDYRKDWKPTSAPFAIFAGEAVDYRVIDTERWWKKGLAEPRDIDPKADLYLTAEFQLKRAVDAKPKAELVVYVLDPAGSPAETLRRHIRERYKKEAELFGETKLIDLSDEPQGDPPSNKEFEGIEVSRVKAESTRDGNVSKLLALASILVGDKVVGAEARCPWEYRGLWERRLMHVAGSLRPGRK